MNWINIKLWPYFLSFKINYSILRLSSIQKYCSKSLNEFREFLKKLIKEKQQKLNSKNEEKTNDILELLIKCGNEEGTNLSDEELIQNLFLFFL